MAVACQGRTALIARPSCPAWCWTRRTDVIFLWYQKLSAKREIGAAATQQSTIFSLIHFDRFFFYFSYIFSGQLEFLFWLHNVYSIYYWMQMRNGYLLIDSDTVNWRTTSRFFFRDWTFCCLACHRQSEKGGWDFGHFCVCLCQGVSSCVQLPTALLQLCVCFSAMRCHRK
jgi:hypothetical protein